MMIRLIKLLRNIGTFNSDAAAACLVLKRLVIVYGENGRGKTTLAAVLRSLATGEALPISERHRLGSHCPPHVVLDCEGDPSIVMFQDGAWNRTLPNLKVFDDVFVDENVHSGLNVDATHRQHLHELILGDQGVALNRRLEKLVSRIGQHTATLRDKSEAIPDQARRGLSIDKFCALRSLPDVESHIGKTERSLMAARNQDDIRSTSSIEMIQLPEFDIDALAQILMTDLADLDEAAAATVHGHFHTLGEGGESWIADGVRRIKPSDGTVCPFCGQDLTGLALVEYYRAYFSESYAALKESIVTALKNTKHTHSEGAHRTFERAIAAGREKQQFWAQYCAVPLIEIDTETVVEAWTTARAKVLDQLKAKLAAPLERQELTERLMSSLSTYNAYRQEIKSLNEALTSSNDLIAEVKQQAQLADATEILAELGRLKATKARHSPELAPLCDDYRQEKNDKARTETKRTEARSDLEEYRATVFPSLQDGVNEYLERFNAGFSHRQSYSSKHRWRVRLYLHLQRSDQ